MALTATTEAGKTEFLKWVFNECCSFNPNPGKVARDVLQRINYASPPDAQKLDSILVLFASFNQESTYAADNEPNIRHSTLERLRRSFEGRVDMDGFDADTPQLRNWTDLVEMFSVVGKKIGYIICIDELSKVGAVNRAEYQKLMDSIMTFSQKTIAQGGYFAVVGSSKYIYDFGEVVLQASTRAMREIRFPSNDQPDSLMEKKTREFVENSGIIKSAPARQENEKFRLEVAIQVAKSDPRMSNWLMVANSETTIKIPHKPYRIPECMEASDVFQLAARTALQSDSTATHHQGGLKLDSMDLERSEHKNILHAVLHRLHGSAKLLGARDNDVYKGWDDVDVTLSLPPYRLLQFKSLGLDLKDQLFPYVQNWVLVELRRLLYTDAPKEIYRTWEVGAMAMLELRKAMLCAVRPQSPSLREILEVGAFLKVNDTILDKLATEETASFSLVDDLPSGSEPCQEPCIYYSSNPCEKGVEGMFRGAFGDLAIFFQMKLRKNSTPLQIKDWLLQAQRRAKDLGYREGTYIVQLFVTGAIGDNVEDHKNEWPDGSVVFADEAIGNLFHPFGKGVFTAMVERRRREN